MTTKSRKGSDTSRSTSAKKAVVSRENKLAEEGNATTCKISLESNLTIANSENFKSILLRSLGKHKKVEIDGTSVEQIDTSCVQLLVSFVKMLENQSVELEWKGVSNPLVNTVRYLGLTKHLKI